MGQPRHPLTLSVVAEDCPGAHFCSGCTSTEMGCTTVIAKPSSDTTNVKHALLVSAADALGEDSGGSN